MRGHTLLLFGETCRGGDQLLTTHISFPPRQRWTTFPSVPGHQAWLHGISLVLLGPHSGLSDPPHRDLHRSKKKPLFCEVSDIFGTCMIAVSQPRPTPHPLLRVCSSLGVVPPPYRAAGHVRVSWAQGTNSLQTTAVLQTRTQSATSSLGASELP